MNSSEPVLKHTDIKPLAIPFDLDVLDPKQFRSTFFGEPEPEKDPSQRIRQENGSILRGEADERCLKAPDVVGLGLTGYLPWDALSLKGMLSRIPILK